MCRWPHRSMASWSTSGLNRYHQSRFLMDDIRMKPCDTRGVLWFIRLVQSARVMFWLVGSMRVRGSVGGSTQSWKLQPKEVLLPQPTFYGTTLKLLILAISIDSRDSLETSWCVVDLLEARQARQASQPVDWTDTHDDKSQYFQWLIQGWKPVILEVFHGSFDSYRVLESWYTTGVCW